MVFSYWHTFNYWTVYLVPCISLLHLTRIRRLQSTRQMTWDLGFRELLIDCILCNYRSRHSYLTSFTSLITFLVNSIWTLYHFGPFDFSPSRLQLLQLSSFSFDFFFFSKFHSYHFLTNEVVLIVLNIISLKTYQVKY